jgi:hypothetical protein
MKSLWQGCLVFFMAASFSGCDKSSSVDCKMAICTLSFEMIEINVLDTNGNPVGLDSYVITNRKNQQDLTPVITAEELEAMQSSGRYMMISDQYLQVEKNTILELNFRGIMGGKTVTSENYSVEVDCCHVSLRSGKQNLLVE